MALIQHKPFSLHPFLSILAMVMLGYVPLHPEKDTMLMMEICDNALDDDGDGLVDLNDPDCACEVVEPVSLIPNPSFEELNCCPSMQSELNCAESWIQASEPTTDFIHMCGWMGWNEFPVPLPFPHGEGIMGFRDGRVHQNSGSPEPNWKEYAGACLLSPLLADSTYVFEFNVGFVNRNKSPDINITFFGTTDCDNLPFGIGNQALGCPTNGPGWVRLGSRFVAGGIGKWIKTTIKVTPDEDITAIAIGPDCPAVVSPISIYYFFDDLKLVDLRSYQFQITEESHPCSPAFTLLVTEQAGFTYQWYKDGIALVGETSAKMTGLYGEGEYRVRIVKDGACKLSGIYRYTIPVLSAQLDEMICDGDIYPFGDRLLTEPGDYVDTFKTVDYCDSIVTLHLAVSGYSRDTVRANIFEGETYSNGTYRFNTEGEHMIHLLSTLGCDSLVIVQLEFYHIYIPNIFSPNGDGINDLFSVYDEVNQIEKADITVFDRWGSQVYHGPEWDGKRDGTYASPGVFTYITRLKMSDGQERQFSGSVTLIR